jgi:hypothetical protein
MNKLINNANIQVLGGEGLLQRVRDAHAQSQMYLERGEAARAFHVNGCGNNSHPSTTEGTLGASYLIIPSKESSEEPEYSMFSNWRKAKRYWFKK